MSDISNGQIISSNICYVTNMSDLTQITDFITSEMGDCNDMIIQAKYNFLETYYPWTMHIHRNNKKSKYFITLLSNEFPLFDVDAFNNIWQISNTYRKCCIDKNILEGFDCVCKIIDLDFADLVKFNTDSLHDLSKRLFDFFTIHYDYPEIWNDHKKECTIHILYKE